MNRFDALEDALGLKVPAILFPKEGTDLKKWAVIACDQYTSQPDYWNEVEKLVGDAPSTLRLILPEIYLETSDEEARIAAIREHMKAYLSEGVFTALPEGAVLLRRTALSKSRLGLVVSLDLEAYDFAPGSSSPIRATEKTIVERIPPRLRIRRGAPIELPHILVLIDDPNRTVLEPLENLDSSSAPLLYDTDLMMGGGHVTGHFIPKESLLPALEALLALKEKTGVLYAVGDGNHSLATAKAAWEEIKPTLSEEERKTHPARFALCELENIHDPGIVFEPIHRVIFGSDQLSGHEMLLRLSVILSEQNGEVRITPKTTDEFNPSAMKLHFQTGSEYGMLEIENPSKTLEVAVLQEAIDRLLAETGVKIDFIHGEEAVAELCKDEHNLGFYLPAMDKFKLFPAVAKDGALPRKTFSMGHAEEKRYYMEAKRI